MPWLYIVIGFFGVAALACLVYAKSKLKLRDRSATHLLCAFKLERAADPAEKYSHQIYELRFHSNVSAGQDRLETHGASLIQRKKKQ